MPLPRWAPSLARRRRTPALADDPSPMPPPAGWLSRAAASRRCTRPLTRAGDRGSASAVSASAVSASAVSASATSGSAGAGSATSAVSGSATSGSASAASAGAPGRTASAGVTPSSAAGGTASFSVSSCCPAGAWVTPDPASWAVATSPATCAPHVCRGIQCIGGRFWKCPARCGGRLCPQQRPNFHAIQLGPAVQERELQQHRYGNHLRPAAPDQLGGGTGGAAGGQDVIDDEHPLAGRERIGVHLDRGAAVFELVGL